MVGDVTKGEYHLEIKTADLSEDDEDYECQVTKYGLRSQKAKLSVLGRSTICLCHVNERFSQAIQKHCLLFRTHC